MTEPSKNVGKTVDGKFARGNRYGRGRPEGSRNKATLAAQSRSFGAGGCRRNSRYGSTACLKSEVNGFVS